MRVIGGTQPTLAGRYGSSSKLTGTTASWCSMMSTMPRRRPFLPVGGPARVLITTTRQSVADLGANVYVDVLGEQEASALLDGRTGLGKTEPRRWRPSLDTCRLRWLRRRR